MKSGVFVLKEGVYEQVINEEISNRLKEINLEKYILEKENIDVWEARIILSNYLSDVTKKALTYIRENNDSDKEALLSQIKAANELIKLLSNISKEDELLNYEILEEGEVLKSLYSKIKEKNVRPVTSLSQSSLFTGSFKEPNMLGELNKEILSSDEVCLLISFIKWSGLRCLMESLIKFTQDDNHKLRVITTTYMGATDFKAIEELGKLKNTEVKISYDVDRTRIHAKSYLFKRETRFSTAYIGSSNISNSALTSGLEWNIKVTEKDSFDIITKIEATFESYWNDAEFISFYCSQRGNIKAKLKHF